MKKFILMYLAGAFMLLLVVPLYGQEAQLPAVSKAEKLFQKGVRLAWKGKNEKAISAYDKASELAPDFFGIYYNRGISWRKLKFYAKAHKDFSTALEKNPKHALSYYNRGLVRLKLDRPEAARIDFDSAANLGFRGNELLYNRSLASRTMGELETAALDLQSALVIEPDRPQWQFMMGELFQQLDNPSQARVAYSRAIELDSTFLQAYRFRGKLEMEEGNFLEATEDFHTVLRMEPEDALTLNYIGDSYRLQGKLGKAEEAYQNLIRTLPGYPGGYLGIGQVYLEQDQPEKAYAEASRALSLDSSLVEAYFIRGIVQKRRQQMLAAEKSFSTCISLDSVFLDAYLERANCRMTLGEYDASEDDLRFALTLKSEWPEARLFAAELSLARGDYEEAISRTDMLQDQDSIRVIALNIRGLAELQLLRYKEALKSFNQAIELSPQSVQTFLNRAYLYSIQEKHKEAIGDYSQVIEIAPGKEAVARNNRGIAKLALGMTDEALEDINKSIELDSENTYAYRNRALVLLKMGNTKKACQDLKKALKMGYAAEYGDDVENLLKEKCE
ncbi:MAG: tetratricopeptide repeat protein [Bacteroidota bacterium]